MGLDFTTKNYITKCDKNEIPVKIWDTAGQERFKTLTQSFYRKADGVIITFDVTEKASFQNVKTWVESINTHANKTAARVLVGNKIDLVGERKVSKKEAEDLAKTFGITFFETSAKANIGLQEAFEEIFEQSYKNKFVEATTADQPREPSIKITAQNAKKQQKKNCSC